MHHQVACHSGSVLMPAAPAREGDRVEGLLRGGSKPCVPIEGCGREVERRRILPSASWLITAELQLNLEDFADRSALTEISRLGEEYGADALRADLHKVLGALH